MKARLSIPNGDGRFGLEVALACLIIALSPTHCSAQTTLHSSAPIYADGAYIVLSGTDLQFDSGAELAGSGTWLLQGSTQQSLSNNAGSNTAFENLELDNSAGLLLDDGPLYISGQLHFTSGVIDAATNSQRVEFGNTADHTGAGTASFIEGPVRKSGSASFIFPVGQDGIYAPARRLTSPDGTYEVSYHAESSPHAGPYYDGSGFPVSTCEYWNFGRISGSDNPRIYFTFEHNDCNDIGDFNFLDLVWWNSLDWDPVIGIDPSATEIGTTSALDPSWTGQFTLSSFNANMNVLPITLMDFTARPLSENQVLLQWTTASEINNDYFTIERSEDVSHWHTIAEVPGAGNSNTILQYQHTDREALPGTSYYRLKQTDYDGTYSYSEVESVYLTSPREEGGLMPPHRADHTLLSQLSGNLGWERAEVFDLLGKRVSAPVLSSNDSDAIRVPLQAARGIYVLRVLDVYGGIHSAKFFW